MGRRPRVKVLDPGEPSATMANPELANAMGDEASSAIPLLPNVKDFDDSIDSVADRGEPRVSQDESRVSENEKEEDEEETSTETDGSDRPKRKSTIQDQKRRIAELESQVEELLAKLKKDRSAKVTAQIRNTVIDLLVSGWDVIAYENGREPIPEENTREWAEAVIAVLDEYNLWEFVNHPITLLVIQSGFMVFAIVSADKITDNDALEQTFKGRKSEPLIGLFTLLKGRRRRRELTVVK